MASDAEGLEILQSVWPIEPLGHNVISMGLFGASADSLALPALPVVSLQALQPESLPGLASISPPVSRGAILPDSHGLRSEERESLGHGWLGGDGESDCWAGVPSVG